MLPEIHSRGKSWSGKGTAFNECADKDSIVAGSVRGGV